MQLKSAKKYLRLTKELQNRRESAGSEGLSPEEEDRYAETLDRFWHEMTDDEQEYVDRQLSNEG